MQGLAGGGKSQVLAALTTRAIRRRCMRTEQPHQPHPPTPNLCLALQLPLAAGPQKWRPAGGRLGGLQVGLPLAAQLELHRSVEGCTASAGSTNYQVNAVAMLNS